MYKSPIELLIEEFDKKIVKKQDADIYQAVLNCGVNVDKDELIRALEYDRGQYEKGFRDGVESVKKKGRWLGEAGDWECSCCGNYGFDGGWEASAFCPNCGAEMEL